MLKKMLSQSGKTKKKSFKTLSLNVQKELFYAFQLLDFKVLDNLLKTKLKAHKIYQWTAPISEWIVDWKLLPCTPYEVFFVSQSHMLGSAIDYIQMLKVFIDHGISLQTLKDNLFNKRQKFVLSNYSQIIQETEKASIVLANSNTKIFLQIDNTQEKQKIQEIQNYLDFAILKQNLLQNKTTYQQKML